MTPILRAAKELQSFLLHNNWPFCIIGGIAVLRWGNPRTTQDVDVSLYVKFGDEAEVIQAVLNRFTPRIENALEFALESKTILAFSSQNVALDILLAQFEFELSIIERATYFEFEPGLELLTISCEDLVVLKAFAGREQDWNDIRGIAIANPEFDMDFVTSQLKQLSDISPENPSMKQLTALIDELRK